MNGLEPKHLKVVERWTLILAAAVLACGYLAAPRPVAVGIAVGAGLMCVNAWAIRKLVEKALPRVGDNAPALGVLLFNVKLLVLAGLVAVAVWQAHPTWRRDRVRRFIEETAQESLEFGEVDAPEEQEENPPRAA